MADDDEEDLDMLDELQELLSGSDSSSIRTPLFDISIPGSASALMSTTQLESMLYRLSQTRLHLRPRYPYPLGRPALVSPIIPLTEIARSIRHPQ